MPNFNFDVPATQLDNININLQDVQVPDMTQEQENVDLIKR